MRHTILVKWKLIHAEADVFKRLFGIMKDESRSLSKSSWLEVSQLVRGHPPHSEKSDQVRRKSNRVKRVQPSKTKENGQEIGNFRPPVYSPRYLYMQPPKQVNTN